MRNLLYGFDIYLVNVKTMRKIAQIFEAFSGKLNFNAPSKTISVHCSGEVNFATCKAEIASCFVAGTPHMCGIHLPPPYTQ